MITDEEARHAYHEKEQIHEDEFHIAKDSKRKSSEIYFLGLQSRVLSISAQEVVNVRKFHSVSSSDMDILEGVYTARALQGPLQLEST